MGGELFVGGIAGMGDGARQRRMWMGFEGGGSQGSVPIGVVLVFFVEGGDGSRREL